MLPFFHAPVMWGVFLTVHCKASNRPKGNCSRQLHFFLLDFAWPLRHGPHCSRAKSGTY